MEGIYGLVKRAKIKKKMKIQGKSLAAKVCPSTRVQCDSVTAPLCYIGSIK
jgi:hypothetical protein